MKLARFQRIEIPNETDEWEGEKRVAVRNSGFTARPSTTSKWTRAIQARDAELVIDFRRSPSRVRLRRIEIVEGGVDDEPDA